MNLIPNIKYESNQSVVAYQRCIVTRNITDIHISRAFSARELPEFPARFVGFVARHPNSF